MADNENITQDTPVGGKPDTRPQPHAAFVGHYVKDLSFENPNAPASLQAQSVNQPKVDVNINVGVRQSQNGVFEVELVMKVTGTLPDQNGGEMVAFVCELNYATLVQVNNLPEEAGRAFLMVTTPTFAFPFARRIISDAIRDGGFAPLLLEPLNFQALYQQRLAHEQEQQAKAAKEDSPVGGDQEAAPTVN